MEADLQGGKVREMASVGTEFLVSGGEMGARIRALDWSITPLGAPADWPQSLKTAVGLLLNSGYPMYVVNQR